MKRGLVRASLLLSVALWGGCMVHERRIESAPGPAGDARSAPLGGSERIYALVVPRTDLLEIRVRAAALCLVRRTRSVAETEILERRPAPARFIGAGAAVAGGTLLLAGEGSDTLGGLLLGAAAAVVVIPMVFEGEDRRELPRRLQVDPGGEFAPCGDRPVGAARLAVRIGAQTLEATTDVAGRARFRDAGGAVAMTVFVNDVAVPVSVGSPPTGTLPALEDPAHPGDPGKH